MKRQRILFEVTNHLKPLQIVQKEAHNLHNKHLIFAFMMADSLSKTCYLHHCQVKLHNCTIETFPLHHAWT